MAGLNSDFYIFTTGISDWGGYGIIDFWKDHLKPSLLGVLQPLVDIGDVRNIIIKHYDPLLEISEGQKADVATDHATELGPDGYFPTPFNFGFANGRKHIVIDFAHVFGYTSTGKPVIMVEPYKGKSPKDTNIVYSGYVGTTDQGNRENRELTLTPQFIFLDRYGGISTYIDLIVSRFGGLQTHDGVSMYPIEAVTDAVNEAKKTIIIRWRARFGRAGDEYDTFIRDIISVSKAMSILAASTTRADFVERVIREAEGAIALMGTN